MWTESKHTSIQKQGGRTDARTPRHATGGIGTDTALTTLVCVSKYARVAVCMFVQDDPRTRKKNFEDFFFLGSSQERFLTLCQALIRSLMERNTAETIAETFPGTNNGGFTTVFLHLDHVPEK